MPSHIEKERQNIRPRQVLLVDVARDPSWNTLDHLEGEPLAVELSFSGPIASD